MENGKPDLGGVSTQKKRLLPLTDGSAFYRYMQLVKYFFSF